MRIIDQENTVVFDNLLSASRAIGSDETITLPKPAEVAVACNARGVFKDRDLLAINGSAEAEGRKIAAMLSS